MSEINVRKIQFEFPEDLTVLAAPKDFDRSMAMLGVSMTLPHLEPYLIRTMRVAMKDVEDEDLRRDMKNFSAQEGFHYRNHARINEIICSKLRPQTARNVRIIEAEMEADYRRFTKEKSLRWNLAYAEGFEAMTLIIALEFFEDYELELELNWRELWEWHLAEEVEHRTVCFDAYEKLNGGYFHRVFWGIRGQQHFLKYVDRFARCIAKDYAGEYGPYKGIGIQPKSAIRMLNTFTPWYNPRHYKIPEDIKQAWSKYDLAAA